MRQWQPGWPLNSPGVALLIYSGQPWSYVLLAGVHMPSTPHPSPPHLQGRLRGVRPQLVPRGVQGRDACRRAQPSPHLQCVECAGRQGRESEVVRGADALGLPHADLPCAKAGRQAGRQAVSCCCTMHPATEPPRDAGIECSPTHSALTSRSISGSSMSRTASSSTARRASSHACATSARTKGAINGACSAGTAHTWTGHCRALD